MKVFTALIIPALATLAAAASIQPRQASAPRVVAAAPLGTSNGCPPGTFSWMVAADGITGVLIFDIFNAWVGPGSVPADREKFCDWVVTIEWPLGCTTGNIIVHPRGDNFIEQSDTGTWMSQYNLGIGTLNPGNPPNIQYKKGTPFSQYNSVAASLNIRNPNQRNVTFTARTRIFLESPIPGFPPSTLSIQSADIYVRDVVNSAC